MINERWRLEAGGWRLDAGGRGTIRHQVSAGGGTAVGAKARARRGGAGAAAGVKAKVKAKAGNGKGEQRRWWRQASVVVPIIVGARRRQAVNKVL